MSDIAFIRVQIIVMQHHTVLCGVNFFLTLTKPRDVFFKLKTVLSSSLDKTRKIKQRFYDKTIRDVICETFQNWHR